MIDNKIKIKKVNINDNNRLLFISDIHANTSLFIEILQKVNYQKNDHLFILGDIIEKGYGNLTIIDYLLELQKENPNLHILLGNCDDIFYYANKNMKNKKDVLKYKNVKINKSILNDFARNLCLPLNEDTVDLVVDSIETTFKKYYDFLTNLPHVIIINDLIYLSHSGIKDTTNLNISKEEVLTNDYFYTHTTSSNIQIVGHLPVINYSTKTPSLNPIIDLNKKIISIDGGSNVIYSYQLNMLILNNINSLDFSYISKNPYKKVRVKEDYYKEEDSFYYKYGIYPIVILEEIEDFYLVRLNDKTLYILKSYAYNKDNNYYLLEAYKSSVRLIKNEYVYLTTDSKPFSYIIKDGYIYLVPNNILDI